MIYIFYYFIIGLLVALTIDQIDEDILGLKHEHFVVTKNVMSTMTYITIFLWPIISICYICSMLTRIQYHSYNDVDELLDKQSKKIEELKHDISWINLDE